MNPEFKVVNIRVFRGLNLLEDARISDPGSFRRLQNIYRQAPGVLASRPGSAVFARGKAFDVEGPSDTLPAANAPGLGGNLDDVVLGETADILHDAGATLGKLLKGIRGMRPRAQASPVTAASNLTQHIPIRVADNLLSTTPAKVAALHRLYTNFGDRRYLIGAFEFEGGDRLFYVDDESSTPVLKLMTVNSLATGAGGEWSFIDFYRKDDDDNEMFAVGTNQIGQPFYITLDANNKPVAMALDVAREDQVDNLVSLGDQDERLMSVNSLCVYNGSVVYGGFQTGTPNSSQTSVELEDKSNYICFSVPGEPHKLVQTGGVLTDIRIGDTKFEPVTKVVVNSISTDAQGIKGQLVVFTTRRVAVYDGLPPVSGNPTGASFHSVALSDAGCVAPKTVVQTPAGLVFLGSDGLIYMIPRYSSGGPIPVSRTVEPLFKHLSLQQQKQCAAVYDDGHYKISFPRTNVSKKARLTNRNIYTPAGNFNKTIPDAQVWLDLRTPINYGEMDLGFVWTGIHTGMKHSCYAVANQHDDFNVLFAGSAVDGTVYQASIEGLASDPNPDDPSTTVPLKYDVLTGQFDADDVHRDKIVRSLQFGINVSRSVSLTSGILTSGEVTGAEAGVNFTDTVAPTGYSLGTASTIANVPGIGNSTSYRLFTRHPAETQRGRTFAFRFRATPSSATEIKFSDLSFVFEMSKRRD